MKEQIDDTIELTEEELASMHGGCEHGYYGYDYEWGWGYHGFNEGYHGYHHGYHHGWGHREFHEGYNRWW
jgi:hypothetical protein